MNRRSFLKRTAAGLLIPAAPAICRADWMMPIKPETLPCNTIWYCASTPSGFDYGDLWVNQMDQKILRSTNNGWVDFGDLS